MPPLGNGIPPIPTDTEIDFGICTVIVSGTVSPAHEPNQKATSAAMIAAEVAFCMQKTKLCVSASSAVVFATGGMGRKQLWIIGYALPVVIILHRCLNGLFGQHGAVQLMGRQAIQCFCDCLIGEF